MNLGVPPFIELPIQDRAMKKFLVDFQKLLISWEFTKSSVHFDDETMEMSVGGAPIVKVAVQDHLFKIEWLETSWGNWSDLTSDPTFQEMAEAVQAKLTDAAKRLDKGKGGKGKSKPST